MDKNEKAEFKAKEIEHVTEYCKRKQSDNDKPVLEVVKCAFSTESV